MDVLGMYYAFIHDVLYLCKGKNIKRGIEDYCDIKYVNYHAKLYYYQYNLLSLHCSTKDFKRLIYRLVHRMVKVFV